MNMGRDTIVFYVGLSMVLLAVAISITFRREDS